jgi:hypothetical protein
LGKVERREGCRCEADGVGAVDGAEGAELRVLLGDHVGGGSVVQKLTREVACERDERDPGVCGDRRGELEELRDLRSASPWWCADDDGRSRLDDEPADREGKGLGIVVRKDAGSRDLPRVEGRVLDRAGSRHEGEDTGVASGWFSFEGHTGERSANR